MLHVFSNHPLETSTHDLNWWSVAKSTGIRMLKFTCHVCILLFIGPDFKMAVLVCPENLSPATEADFETS